MLAENLQHWAEQEREIGRKEARQEILAVKEETQQKLRKKVQEIALKLIALDSITDEQIADISGFSLEEIAALRKSSGH